MLPVTKFKCAHENNSLETLIDWTLYQAGKACPQLFIGWIDHISKAQKTACNNPPIITDGCTTACVKVHKPTVCYIVRHAHTWQARMHYARIGTACMQCLHKPNNTITKGSTLPRAKGAWLQRQHCNQYVSIQQRSAPLAYLCNATAQYLGHLAALTDISSNQHQAHTNTDTGKKQQYRLPIRADTSLPTAADTEPLGLLQNGYQKRTSQIGTTASCVHDAMSDPYQPYWVG